MMLQSRANEIRGIILELGSRSPARVDAARARLSILGARAVEDLIEALEGGTARVRARVMPLLALIQDPRGRQPLIAMLLDRNVELREIAARSLARFPTPEVAAALNRALDREPGAEVRIAIVRALVEHYAAGQEQALRRVVELLLDPHQNTPVRLAAFGLLPLLGRPERLRLCERLAEDPQAEIRRQIARLVEHDTEPWDGVDVGELLGGLGADDYAVWNDAVHRLGAGGPQVVRPIVEAMRARAHDAEYCARAGMALKALGPRRGRTLVELLDEVDEPQPLAVLVEVVGALGENALIYRLKSLIERLAAPDRGSDGAVAPGLGRVRAKAHLELARIGSRVAVEDLCRLLADPGGTLDLEALAAIEAIGKRDELGVLLRVWDREGEFLRARVADVVRSIMRRERIRRNDRRLQTLGPVERRALEVIVPPAPSRPRRPVGTRSETV